MLHWKSSNQNISLITWCCAKYKSVNRYTIQTHTSTQRTHTKNALLLLAQKSVRNVIKSMAQSHCIHHIWHCGNHPKICDPATPDTRTRWTEIVILLLSVSQWSIALRSPNRCVQCLFSQLCDMYPLTLIMNAHNLKGFLYFLINIDIIKHAILIDAACKWAEITNTLSLSQLKLNGKRSGGGFFLRLRELIQTVLFDIILIIRCEIFIPSK